MITSYKCMRCGKVVTGLDKNKLCTIDIKYNTDCTNGYCEEQSSDGQSYKLCIDCYNLLKNKIKEVVEE